VLTDWLLVRRLAAELDRALRGRRIRGAGALVDGRFGVRVPDGTLTIDVFGPLPIALLEEPLPLERRPGWTRTIGDALDGLRIERVRARRGDRLVAFDCAAQSRFGVASGYRLVAELVPRFGNLVLLKDDTVVCAAKEFTRAQNARRATLAGEPYEPPPLPDEPGDGKALPEAFEELARSDGAAARALAVRALRAAVPLVPRLVAESLIAESARAAGASPSRLADRCIERALALVSATEGEPDALGDAYAYRDGASLVQCHVVPLFQFAALTCSRAPALLPLLAEAAGGVAREQGARGFAARRSALAARLQKRRTALASERAAIERERDDVAATDALRLQGELLYAHLDQVPSGASRFVPPSDPSVTIVLDPELDPKANAAAIFKRYRKAVTKRTHVAERLERLARDEALADDLAWEAERAEPETIAEVAESVERFERPKAARARAVRGAPQRPLSIRLSEDARVYVGRSPRGNAELTFRQARPDDLWFHARATPGAHVVLQFDARREPAPAELEAAAQLAAYHSKARGSEKVAVDYTERKYVRRQANAPPGLVWYTKARTLVVAPRAVETFAVEPA
jgi:predicted ribosome quality control (RQC) complex YloA/Tae2 family protein